MQISFNGSERSSLGVEVELQIVDRETWGLSSGATPILAAVGSEGVHPKVKHELMESNLELVTGVCETAAQARADLEETLAEVSVAASELGLALCCAGTHPFSDWSEQRITANERYERLVEEMAWPARRLNIFGIHCHVGVRSAEKAIAIANAASAYIPHFLALSASSPFWMGKDTGLASVRSKIFEALPTAGLPQQLADWAEFETYMTTLMRAGTISSIREVWWDIRPHPMFGTVELRICDGIPTMSEIVTVAALSQCLVDWLDTLDDRGYGLPCPRAWVVRENKWRAARHGIDADIILDESGKVAPLRVGLTDLIEELGPVAKRLKCSDELAGAGRILDHGPSYLRQRGLVAGGASLPDVVSSLVDELRTDRPAS